MASICLLWSIIASLGWCPTGETSTRETGLTIARGPWRWLKSISRSQWSWNRSTCPRRIWMSCPEWRTCRTSWRRRTALATMPLWTGSRTRFPTRESTTSGWESLLLSSPPSPIILFDICVCALRTVLHHHLSVHLIFLLRISRYSNTKRGATRR